MSKAEGGRRKADDGEPGASATGDRKSEVGGQSSEVRSGNSVLGTQYSVLSTGKPADCRDESTIRNPQSAIDSTLDSQLSTLDSSTTHHSPLTGLFCCLVGLTALTLAAAHAPGRIRLLGLFAVAFGAVCGWGLARGAAYFAVTVMPVDSSLKRKQRNDNSRPSLALQASIMRLVIVGVLIAAAETGLTLESWRLYVVELRKLYDPEASTEAVGGGQPFVPDSLLKQAREERQQVLVEKSRFAAYLQHRVKELGDWSAPWPAVFWLGELLLGTAAGVVVFRQSADKRP
jgi:hypothetical protein